MAWYDDFISSVGNVALSEGLVKDSPLSFLDHMWNLGENVVSGVNNVYNHPLTQGGIGIQKLSTGNPTGLMNVGKALSSVSNSPTSEKSPSSLQKSTDAIGNVMNTASQGIGLYDQASKVFGIPTPATEASNVNYAQEGSNYKQWLDNAYPGTTAFEQLGGGSGNASGLAGQALGAATQSKMQQQELGNRTALKVMELNNAMALQNRQILGNIIDGSQSKSEMESKIGVLSGQQVGEFDTTTTVHVKKLEKELDLLGVQEKETLYRSWNEYQQALDSGNEEAIRHHSSKFDSEFTRVTGKDPSWYHKLGDKGNRIMNRTINGLKGVFVGGFSGGFGKSKAIKGFAK